MASARPSKSVDRRKQRSRGTSGPGKQNSKLTPAGLRWIIPGFVLSVGLIYFCIGYSGYISTRKWNGSKDGGTFIGMDNYTHALTDPLFWGALRHTVIFFVVFASVQIFMGIFFAAILHSKIHFAVVYKVLIFLPVVIAPAIMSPVHRQVFATNGPINWILQHVGLGHFAQSWLAQTTTALLVVIAVQIWSSIGFAFILFYASMSQIDPETLEAARIDGAGNIRVLIAIVLPEVRGTIVALLILNVITSLKLFDYPYLLTRGGPVYASDFLGTFIHRETVALADLGYASALSIFLLVLALSVSFAMGARTRKSQKEVSGV